MDKYSTNTTNDYYNRTTNQNQTRLGNQMQTQMPSGQRQMTIASDNITAGAPQSITPTTMESTYYLAGLLTTFIGSRVRVQFLIGTTGPLLDIVGTLIQVGANYIIIQPIETDDLMICDLFSIKFTTVYR